MPVLTACVCVAGGHHADETPLSSLSSSVQSNLSEPPAPPPPQLAAISERAAQTQPRAAAAEPFDSPEREYRARGGDVTCHIYTRADMLMTQESSRELSQSRSLFPES